MKNVYLVLALSAGCASTIPASRPLSHEEPENGAVEESDGTAATAPMLESNPPPRPREPLPELEVKRTGMEACTRLDLPEETPANEPGREEICSLIDGLETTAAGSIDRPDQGLAPCPDADLSDVGEYDAANWYDYCASERGYRECMFGRGAIYDRDAARWVVLDADWSEGGLETLYLYSLTATSRNVILGGSPSIEDVTQLCAAAIAYNQHPSVRDLVRGRSAREFSLSEYSPFVALGGAFEGYFLYAKEGSLAENRMGFWLVEAATLEATLVASVVPTQGPCDGSGWSCDDVEQDACDAAALQAEGRLCVQPVAIGRVAFEAGSMLIMGGVVVAGHGGAPPFSIVASVPEPNPT